MNKKNFTKVALRYRAVFLDICREEIDLTSCATAPVVAFTARLKENGFVPSEELLHALNAVPADCLEEITECIKDVMGVKLNWASLVKGWDVPTGESEFDHFVTLFFNLIPAKKRKKIKGETLPCGHFVPEGTFPLERYNGCPFCGTPFRTADYVYTGQGSKLKELRLFTLEDMRRVFNSLLTSSTPLDGTQRDSLSILMQEFPLPEDVKITMKETAMLVVKMLVEQGRDEETMRFMKTPTDVLRYLWFEKTGYAQIIEPKTLVAHAHKLYSHIWPPLHRGANGAAETKKRLRLKYNRKACARVARWLNALPVTAEQAAEMMNPKRGMWVRMIHALRLGEYSRKQGFERLAELLDVFYKQEYTTWQGRVDKARMANKPTVTLDLLKERPGLFARSLFSTMLRFGSKKVLNAFSEVADEMPVRLLLSLGNAADIYFDPKSERIASPITGSKVVIAKNPLMALYSEDELKSMAAAVNDLYKNFMARRFAAQPTEAKSIFIAPMLYNIPVSVGDRTTTIQDTSCALMGTRFPVEGDSVRLFLQWGAGLHAQWLDMDLSCHISFRDGKVAECAYYNLKCVGAKHSGDFQYVPEMVGTAEYIELSLPKLEKAGAKFVTFTCNAYSCGALSPNLMVGWMNSANPMKISEKTGVAYDPSCVQHIVRVSEGNLSKGLVFGVLDVAKREIVWLEMPFTGQTLRSLNTDAVEALLQRLEAKLSIGQLLDIKAKAQKLTHVETADQADEAYTYDWALNPAEVTKLLDF